MHFGLLRLLFAGRFNFEIDSSGLIENKTERMIFMSKIAVVYWSGTGNTEAMANAVLEGAKNAGADAVSYTHLSKSTDELLSLFSEINRNGQTILMVTHSVKAASHAGRVLFIKDGEVFHQLYRGNNTNQQLYQKISDTLTMLATGGDRR